MKIVIVGAGPAGLAAACCASESGADVTLVDDNHATGGQIWRALSHPFQPRLQSKPVSMRLGSRVISANPTEILVESEGGVERLPFDKLILATGARELFLPFPGWTLPGVFGAGGLQALAKSGLDIRNKRIVVAGSGPLLLAVAHYFQKHGAQVLLIAEQAPWGKLMRFARALPVAKWPEALRFWNRRFMPAAWVTEAHGQHSLKSVTLHTNGGLRNIPCDYLATGYGLVPNREIADLLGVNPCTLDEYQRTSQQAIFCAGEVTGIGGVDLSVVEGRIAGYAAAGDLDRAKLHFAERRRWKGFQQALDKAFALRPELKRLPQAATFICRCEDVTYSQLADKANWQEAKIQSRCGMGPCQGRVCGPATEFLFGWTSHSVRPPLFPCRVGSLSIIEDKIT